MTLYFWWACLYLPLSFKTAICHVDQTDLELMVIFLPLPLMFWHYAHASIPCAPFIVWVRQMHMHYTRLEVCMNSRQLKVLADQSVSHCWTYLIRNENIGSVEVELVIRSCLFNIQSLLDPPNPRRFWRTVQTLGLVRPFVVESWRNKSWVLYQFHAQLIFLQKKNIAGKLTEQLNRSLTYDVLFQPEEK